MGVCPQPFNRIEIYENGDVFNCCPSFLNNYSIGNIYEKSFEEVWNSDKAIALRRKILNNDYSLCSDLCFVKHEYMQKTGESHEYAEIMNDYPLDISISSDNACNVRCKICRDHNFNYYINEKEFDEKMKNNLLPAFKNAQIVRFGCSGEPFASNREKKLIKAVFNKYPKLKAHIHTNGILGDKKLLKDLKIYDKTEKITVSLHSATPEMYKNIVVGGNYKKVLKNLELYSEMKKKQLISDLRLIFVVYSENFREMPEFVEFGKKYGARIEFWALRKNESTHIGRNYEKYSVIDKEHELHEELVNVLKSDIFDSESVRLYSELEALRAC